MIKISFFYSNGVLMDEVVLKEASLRAIRNAIVNFYLKNKLLKLNKNRFIRIKAFHIDECIYNKLHKFSELFSESFQISNKIKRGVKYEKIYQG